MDSIYIDNANLLSYSKENQFFDGVFRFGSRKNFTVSARVENYSNTYGVTGVLSGLEAIRLSLNNDYSEININGFDFGRGKLIDFSEEEGNFVQEGIYSLSFEVYESGDMSQLTGEYYDNLNFLTEEIGPSLLLENFSETFNFQSGEDSFSFEHDLSITFGSGDGVLASPIERAKGLATVLFRSDPNFGFLEPFEGFIDSNNYKHYFNESYDEINNVCTFKKNFSSTNKKGDYDLVSNISLEFNDGIVTVTENASINGLVSPLEESLMSGIDIELSDAFNKCSDAFNDYYSGQNIHPLKPTVLSKQINVNKFEGEGEYNISFSNSLKNEQDWIWSYTLSISRTENDFYEISEQGEIIGLGATSSEKIQNAEAGFSNILTGLEKRVTDFYEEETNRSFDIFLNVRSKAKDRFNGRIQYNYQYTDDQTLDTEDFKKIDISIEDSEPDVFKNDFNVINNPVVVQPLGKTKGFRTMRVRILSNFNAEFTQLKTKALTLFNDNIPSGNDVYIESMTYNYDEINNSIDSTCTWIFWI